MTDRLGMLLAEAALWAGAMLLTGAAPLAGAVLLAGVSAIGRGTMMAVSAVAALLAVATLFCGRLRRHLWLMTGSTGAGHSWGSC